MDNLISKTNKIKDLLSELIEEYGDGVQFSFKIEDLRKGESEGDGMEMMNVNNMEVWLRFRQMIDKRWHLLNEYDRFLSHTGNDWIFRVICIKDVEGLKKDTVYRAVEANFSKEMDEFLFKLEDLEGNPVKDKFSSTFFVLDNYQMLN